MKTETKPKLLAFHGSQELKDQKIAEMKKHKELDELAQGAYVKKGKVGFRGCAVTCTLVRPGEIKEDLDGHILHRRYEDELGIPEEVAQLEDRIFEDLDWEEAKEFPLQFLEAIKPGADLTQVGLKLKIWLLVDKEHGVINFIPKGKSYSKQCRDAVKGVAALLKKELKGKEVSEEEKTAAAYAAADADAYAAADAAHAADAAAYAAADAAHAAAYAARAADAAYAAAHAAADAAHAAAYAARAANAAAYAARKEHFSAIKTRCLELLAEAV